MRIRRGASYHGLALNVSLDLRPFERINVCGYRGLAVTRLIDHVPLAAFDEAAGAGAGAGAGGAAVDAAARGLTPHLLRRLKFEPHDGAVYSAISTDLQAVNSR